MPRSCTEGLGSFVYKRNSRSCCLKAQTVCDISNGWEGRGARGRGRRLGPTIFHIFSRIWLLSFHVSRSSAHILPDKSSKYCSSNSVSVSCTNSVRSSPTIMYCAEYSEQHQHKITVLSYNSCTVQRLNYNGTVQTGVQYGRCGMVS